MKAVSHKNHLLKQRQRSFSKLYPPKPIGLEPGELGVIRDPSDLRRVHSYMLADGREIKLNNDSVPSKVPTLEPSLMVLSEAHRGPRNTLAFRFGEMMLMAQSLFGPRDTSILFLGIEFISHPARVMYVGGNAYVIQLSYEAMRNPMQAYASLAHECIHLLSPDPHMSAKIIEEGMATVFAQLYLRKAFDLAIDTTAMASYDEAEALVAKLLAIDPYGIRKMREEQPEIRKITPALIQKYFPGVPQAVAARLTRTFLSGENDSAVRIARYEHESQAAETDDQRTAAQASGVRQ